MKIGTTKDGRPCVIVGESGVALLDGTHGPSFETVQDIIARSAEGALELSGLAELREDALPNVAEVGLAAPLPLPRRNVICVGKNYVAHAKEFSGSGFDSSAKAGEDVPEFPIVFTKAPETVVGPEAAIEVPSSLTEQVDYEAEIAVIIARGGRFISEADALDHVFGYSLINDVTARDLQKQHKQWFLGKSIETFCPLGPVITTADAIDLGTLQITCHVNGALRQEAPARDMIFSVQQIISVVSRSMTLLPGDIIATGTPAGVAIGMSPPAFLKDGDVVTVASDQLGVLSNPVRIV